MLQLLSLFALGLLGNFLWERGPFSENIDVKIWDFKIRICHGTVAGTNKFTGGSLAKLDKRIQNQFLE